MGIAERTEVAVFEIRGADRIDFLQRLTTNNVAALRPGSGMATVLTNAKGRIVDLLTVYYFSDHLLATGAAAAAKSVIEHLNKYTITEDFTIVNVSEAMSVFAIVEAGDEEMESLFSLPADVVESALHSHALVTVGNRNDLFARGAFFRGGGWTMIVNRNESAAFLNNVLTRSAVLISPEVLLRDRIIAGVPIFGHELGDRYNPLECGAESAVSFNKGCYLGQEVIARLQSQKKVQRALMKIEMDAVPAEMLPLVLLDGEAEIGELTSVVSSPKTNGAIGLCVVRREFAEDGRGVTVQTARGVRPATLIFPN